MANMSRSRLEHSSLFYHIKDGYLSKEWSVEVTNESLSFDTETSIDGSIFTHYRVVDPIQSVYSSLPTTVGRGWVYFEPRPTKTCQIYDPSTGLYIPSPGQLRDSSFTIPQQAEESLVVIRDESNNIIPRDQYDIDYKRGRIRHFDVGFVPPGKVATSGTPTTADYLFHLVGLVDGWPDDENPPELPFIAIYPDSSLKNGFQLGPGVKSSNTFILDIFAENSGQRMDLLDGIHKSLYKKKAAVLDLNRFGGPLRHNGTFNTDFLQTFIVDGKNVQTYLTLNPGNGASLYFNNVEVDYNTTPRMSRASISKFRGRITVTTETYSDRGIDTVGNLAENPEPLGGFDSLRLESYSS